MRHQPWEYNTSFLTANAMDRDWAALALNCKQTFPCGTPHLHTLLQRKITTVLIRLIIYVFKNKTFSSINTKIMLDWECSRISMINSFMHIASRFSLYNYAINIDLLCSAILSWNPFLNPAGWIGEVLLSISEKDEKNNHNTGEKSNKWNFPPGILAINNWKPLQWS